MLLHHKGVGVTDLLIISLDEGLWPVHHEQGFYEGVGGLGDARGLATEEGLRTQVNQRRQLSAVEEYRGVVEVENFIHANEVLEQVAIPLYLLHAVHVLSENVTK